MTEPTLRVTPNGPNESGEYRPDAAPNAHATTVPVVEFKNFQPRQIEQAEIEGAQLPPLTNQGTPAR